MKIVGETNENLLELSDSVKNSDGQIMLRGKGSRVRIGTIHNPWRFSLSLGSNCTVDIADNVWITGVKIHCDDGSSVSIDSWTGFNGKIRLNAWEGRDIFIGRGALLADGVELATGDSHSVFDLDTKLRLNQAGDITIGQRVWLCAGVRVMKNVKIGSGSVVALGAIVTKSIPNHCLAAGVPAKVIRRRITWDQRKMDSMPPEAAEIFDDVIHSSPLIKKPV
jgi:acetyltransferase-like isoleucine patch superfamily enzyme